MDNSIENRYGLDDYWNTWSLVAVSAIDKHLKKCETKGAMVALRDTLQVTMVLSNYIAKYEHGIIYGLPYASSTKLFIKELDDYSIVTVDAITHAVEIAPKGDLYSVDLLFTVKNVFASSLLGAAWPEIFYKEDEKLFCQLQDGKILQLTNMFIENYLHPESRFN